MNEKTKKVLKIRKNEMELNSSADFITLLSKFVACCTHCFYKTYLIILLAASVSPDSKQPESICSSDDENVTVGMTLVSTVEQLTQSSSGGSMLKRSKISKT